MKADLRTAGRTEVARLLAAEDVRPGDFVGILYQIVEYPSFFWSCDAQLVRPDELVRLQLCPADSGTPLKIVSVCLPFLFAKLPGGTHVTLDVRRHRLVRLSRSYARTVWKVMSKQQPARLG